MLLRRALAIFVFSACCCAASLAGAADFRIKSEVFAGVQTEALAGNTTLFRNSMVYDYVEGPGEVTIFDPNGRRFVLLSPERKLRCQIATSDVMQFSEQLRARAAQSEDPLIRFMGNPKFETSFEPDYGDVMLSSRLMTYRLSTMRVDKPEAMREYMEFSNWYARLNSMLNIGSPLPFARIAMNQVLASRKEMPTEVHLTLVTQAGKTPREVSLSSKHTVQWRLLKEDLARIEETTMQLAAFREVDVREFQQLGDQQPGGPPKTPNTPNTAAQPKPTRTR